MPSILIIAYYFPPMGMGGVQRVLKFAKYLPEFGWDVTVIAPEVPEYHALDDSLLADLPKSVRVERVPYRDRGLAVANKMPAVGSSGIRKLASLLDWPDRHRAFANRAIERARELEREKSFDVVFTTSPPPSVHLVGLALRERIPWIADFRDPWQAQLDDYGPTFVHWKSNRELHHRILKEADAVVGVTLEQALHFSAMVPPAKIVTIRNGYDEADFHRNKARIDEAHPLTITLPGTFSAFSDPTPILQGIATWRNANRTRNIRIRHVGSTRGVNVSGAVRQLGLMDIYEESGYVEHERAIDLLLESDVLAMAYTDPHVTSVSVPGRIYEALRSQLPILVVTPPEGALGNLLGDIVGCELVAPSETSSIPDCLNRLTAGPRVARSVESVSAFDRKAQTRQLSEAARTVIENRQSARR